MKTGVEIIAKELEVIDPTFEEYANSGEENIMIDEAGDYLDQARVLSSKKEPIAHIRQRIRELAKAGALIAAEIDRLNNVKQ